MRRVVSDCAIFLIDKAVKMAIMTWLSSECTEIVTTYVEWYSPFNI